MCSEVFYFAVGTFIQVFSDFLTFSVYSEGRTLFPAPQMLSLACVSASECTPWAPSSQPHASDCEPRTLEIHAGCVFRSCEALLGQPWEG